MEEHDLMIECARLSLDPIEGSSEEEKHCPVTSHHPLRGPTKVNSENYMTIMGQADASMGILQSSFDYKVLC